MTLIFIGEDGLMINIGNIVKSSGLVIVSTVAYLINVEIIIFNSINANFCPIKQNKKIVESNHDFFTLNKVNPKK